MDSTVLLDALAIRHSIGLVSAAGADDWTRPTPCAAWTLADLVAHMTAQHRGFAAAANGTGADLAHWVVHPLGDDGIGDYRAAAEEVLAAFAAVDAPDRPFALPEFTAAQAFPAATAIGFHLIDYVVHSWDVAATLGLPFEPEPDLLEAALPIALAVPDGALRLDPGSAFAPSLEAAGDAATLDRILAVLGRSPTWTPR